MYKFLKYCVRAALAISFGVLVAGIIQSVQTFAATTPSLGAAATFGILATTYTNTAPGTIINGDLGYTVGPAFTPTVNGTTHIADSVYSQAGAGQSAALAALNAQPCDFNFGSATDLSLLPQPLTPGVYCIIGAGSIGTGGITLTGGGTYIFRMTGALTTVAGSSITLGGASVCDIFWTPGGATALITIQFECPKATKHKHYGFRKLKSFYLVKLVYCSWDRQ